MKFDLRKNVLALILLLAFNGVSYAKVPEGKDWKLVWEDNFDYPNAKLDEGWVSQNGPSGHILCSRWRENAVVKNSTLRLVIKKEEKAGQEWTAGNIWTKAVFKYGYFECRYKYAAATGTNNSFWLMTQRNWQKIDPEVSKHFEIDINEGHYPDKINTNLHNWSDIVVDEKTGKKTHPSDQMQYVTLEERRQAGKTIELENPVKTSKLRWSTPLRSSFLFKHLRVFEKSSGTYPDPYESLDENSDLKDYAKNAKVIKSSPHNPEHPRDVANNILDGKIQTFWRAMENPKGNFVELDLGEDVEIGAIQFLTGWNNKGTYVSHVSDYKIQYWNDKTSSWEFLAGSDKLKQKDNLGKSYHTYGLEWNENELIYYFDDKEIRRIKNEFAHWESPIWLSLAIMIYSGYVGEEMDGTAMQVDYVKVWQKTNSNATFRIPSDSELKLKK